MVVSAEVRDVDRISQRVDISLPAFDEVLDSVRPVIKQMRDEAPDWVVYEVAATEQIRPFIDAGSLLGFIMSHRTSCSGLGLHVTDNKVTYTQTRATAQSPQAWYQATGKYPTVTKTVIASGQVTTQGEVTQLGRMNGIFGWSADRNLIVGALASFTHNFISMLLGYFKRAKLPVKGKLPLPNMVLEETKVPKQFHPSASFTFSHLRPSVMNRYSLVVSSETPATIGIDFWDINKKDMARIESLDIPAGTSKAVIQLRGPPFAKKAGYFTVNVVDAPKGVTIESIGATPVLI